MTLLTAQTIADEGITPAYALVTASDTIDVGSAGTYAYLHVKNTSGSPSTVTVTDSSKSGAGNAAVSDTVVVAASTGDKKIRIRRELADANGIVTVTHSAPGAGVTSGLFRLA